MPQPFECAGKSLRGDAWIDVARAEREGEAIVITFGLQDRRHAFVGERPVVPGLFRIVVMQVLLADLEPDAQRLALRLGDEMVVIFPRAARRPGVRR